MNITKGDRVRYISSSDTLGRLEIGCTYTVLKGHEITCGNKYIKIKVNEWEEHFFPIEHFKLVNPLKKGDIVQCIEETNIYCKLEKDEEFILDVLHLSREDGSRFSAKKILFKGVGTTNFNPVNGVSVTCFTTRHSAIFPSFEYTIRDSTSKNVLINNSNHHEMWYSKSNFFLAYDCIPKSNNKSSNNYERNESKIFKVHRIVGTIKRGKELNPTTLYKQTKKARIARSYITDRARAFKG